MWEVGRSKLGRVGDLNRRRVCCFGQRGNTSKPTSQHQLGWENAPSVFHQAAPTRLSKCSLCISQRSLLYPQPALLGLGGGSMRAHSVSCRIWQGEVVSNVSPLLPLRLTIKYTIRSIVCEAFCHSVTWSLGHSVTQSLSHSVTWSLGHLVNQSLGHSVTRSLSHSVTRFQRCE